MGVLVRCVALALCLMTAIAAAKEPSVDGDRLVFALSDLDGNAVTSSDRRFDGKVVYVTIWGTWCPPCRTEIPTFNKLQDRYGDDGLVIVGIAFERGSNVDSRRRKLRKFSEKYDINYLVLDGGDTSQFEAALPMMRDVGGFPVEMLIDRSGRVVECRNGYGYKGRWARKLKKEIKHLLRQGN